MPIQLPPDSTGKLIETVVVTSSENREVMILGSTTLAYAPVTTSGGLLSNLSSGTVTLSSVHTVTATAGTNPWSSAPGFNVPVVSVSSGLVQISGTPLVNVVGTSSGVAVVTTSGGLVVQATGPFSLSSQISVTSTAATNPWSSAPGFNVPVVTVSSGLVQISGTPLVNVVGTSSGVAVVTTSGGLVVQATGPFGTVTVLSASSGLIQLSGPSLVSLATTAVAPIAVLVTSSGGPVVSAGVNTAAGYGPVTSSAGRLSSLSSGTVTLSSVHTVTATGPVTITSGTVTLSSVHTILSASSGFIFAFVAGSSGGAFAPVTSSGGLLVSISSGTVTLSSVHTVTATAGTNPWSSAPGFNVPVVTVSSGISQVLIPTNTVAGFGPVTSSAGQLASLSSGTVTLSSVHTVTATAGTNPWSSAPGFNVPVVSVSSGFIRAFPVGAVTTSGLTAYHAMSTGGNAVATNVTTAPASLYAYAVFNAGSTTQAVKVYNSTAPTVGGSTANLLLTIMAPGPGGANLALPMGIYSSNGWSYVITANVNDTDTGASTLNNLSLGLFYQT